MARSEKLLRKFLGGTADRSIRFTDLISLLRRLGFDERVRGSHHIFTRDRVEEILNLQPKAGGMAKPYQVRQVRGILVKYRLGGDVDGD